MRLLDTYHTERAGLVSDLRLLATHHAKRAGMVADLGHGETSDLIVDG